MDRLSLLPAEYFDTARALVDPGHDANILRQAAPLPSPACGLNVYSVPDAVTYSVTVPAGGSMLVFTHPDPSIAFVYHDVSTSAYYAVPTAHSMAACPTLPGMTMQSRGYTAARCTAKSLTLDNATPVLNKGGYCLARRMNLPYSTIRYYTVPATLNVTDQYNMRVLGEVPSNAAEFCVGSSYMRHGHDGVYIVSTLQTHDFSWMNKMELEVNRVYGTSLPGATSVLNQSLVGTTGSYIGVNTNALQWAPGTVNTSGGSTAVFSTGISDQMSVSAVLLVAPSGNDQTFTVKFQGRYEYVVDPVSPDFVKSVQVYPDMNALQLMVAYAAEMPISFDASYNAGGKVWNAFKKGLAWVGSKLSSLVKAGAPILSAAGGAALGAFKDSVTKSLSQ